MNKLILKELRYGAQNYSPLHVMIKQGKGIFLTDMNDRKYYDFLSGYSAVNQGHCHPRLVNVVKEQVEKLTLTSRAFHSDSLGNLCEFMCNTFNYNKYLPMNTGVEGGETAIKLARKWAYEKKNIEPNKAINLFCKNNFWGRTITALSSSTDYKCYNNFGPYTNGLQLVDYNNLDVLEDTFKSNPNIASFMVEPIQGEAGVIVPGCNYLFGVSNLCKKYNILFIADEVQSGLGRSGKLLACDYDAVKPDILILGKSLSGGFYPISGVLANYKVMNTLKPGQHGSTYGGNPLANKICMEAVKILFDENLIERSYEMGKYFRKILFHSKLKGVKEVRGRGLFNAIEFENDQIAEKVLENLVNNRLLTQITRGNVIRLCPPLVINNDEMNRCIDIIIKSINY